jgi:hypothetical protein
VHVGLGSADIQDVEIRWPSGLVESVTIPLDQITTIVEGTGKKRGAR